MSYVAPKQFVNVTATCKANVYFDGKVISHSIHFADGTKKSLGLLFPGLFRFNTEAPERMEILAGSCRVRIADQGDWIGFTSDTWFDVPGNSAFEIEVTSGIAEYICSFG